MTINISELEQLRGKMTTEFHEDDIIVFDVGEDSDLYERGLMAEHNAMPALLALARAVVELEQANAERDAAYEEWKCDGDRGMSVNPRLSSAVREVAKRRTAYDAARAAVTL
jgi:hypothetical protein